MTIQRRILKSIRCLYPILIHFLYYVKSRNGKRWWFSVGLVINSSMYSHWWKIYFKKNPLQDLLSSLNAVISTNESTEFITGQVIYNPAYTYKFQLKTTLKSRFFLSNTFKQITAGHMVLDDGSIAIDGLFQTRCSLFSKLYVPSTLNNDLTFKHLQ